MKQTFQVQLGEVFGFLRSNVDAHTLGVSCVRRLLEDCGYRVIVATPETNRALECLPGEDAERILCEWLTSRNISHLGFSYRLDPNDGVRMHIALYAFLKKRRLLVEDGGVVRRLSFAGLPATCSMIQDKLGARVDVFCGDESPERTLEKMGVPPEYIPRSLSEESVYDEARMQFAADILNDGEHLDAQPIDRSGYPEYGTDQDSLIHRMMHGIKHGLPPLIRAHAGPYLTDREKAVTLFLDWCQQLSNSKFLDILSVATSQLTQSNFNEDWGEQSNGGGVPINSELEFRMIAEAAHPMLVRTYAGTTKIPELARVYEKTLNTAWHALSLWWFNEIDGRGPLSLLENLQQHISTVQYIASTNKPFEANVPHHFGFRGSDDISYVLSALLAAHVAKRNGIRWFVLQNMLNTPKAMWGIQDLAKSRATLALIGELSDTNFTVILQPRAGLDYLSHDVDKARLQLSAVTALMDDIEPNNKNSPGIIHVVSYSEGNHLADPLVIKESIQIVQHTLKRYREARSVGLVDDLNNHPGVEQRATELIESVRLVLGEIMRCIPDPFSARGLYSIFASGFLPVPDLMFSRKKFPEAVSFQTAMVNGGVQVVDVDGTIVAPAKRAAIAAQSARRLGLTQ